MARRTIRPSARGEQRGDRDRAVVEPSARARRPGGRIRCRARRGTPARPRAAARTAGSSIAARCASTAASSARHSTASAPCPTCGSIIDGSSTSVACGRSPSRSSAATATTTASKSRALSTRVGDVAAQLGEREVGPEVRELAAAAHRSGGDGAAGREPAERRADERVAGVGPLGERADAPGRRRAGRAGPWPSAPRGRRRPTGPPPGPRSRTRRCPRSSRIGTELVAVAPGRDDERLRRARRAARSPVGLGPGEGAAPGRDAQRRHRAGGSSSSGRSKRTVSASAYSSPAPGARAVLQPDGRLVQQLVLDALGQGHDRGALLVGERREPVREPLELARRGCRRRARASR